MITVVGDTYMKIPGLPGGLVPKEGLSNGGRICKNRTGREAIK